MIDKTSLFALLALTCVFSQSCQTGPNEPPAVDSRQFQDLVVPSGFRLKDRVHESFSREVASWRTGHYVYSGRPDVASAAAYVEANMGRHSWSLVPSDDVQPGDDQAAGDDEPTKTRLQFERGIYSADYVFERADGFTTMVVDYKTDFSRL
jgi:hypothetical protein